MRICRLRSIVPEAQRRKLTSWPKRYLYPIVRLLVVLGIVFLFLFSWYTYYKGNFFTPWLYCHGSNTVHIPSNDRELEAECQWNDKGRHPMILYGTIKGTGSKMFTANDPYNPIYIMDRTLRNWASLSGVQPVIFTEDDGVIRYIEGINAEVERDIATHGKKATYRNVIHYIRDFEHGTRVKRAPTYRGMLRTISQVYPEADLFIFANADILFTSSLVKTGREVQRYYDCVVKPNNPLMHGLFVTGRRVNFIPKPQFNPWTNNKSMPQIIHAQWKPLPPWERALLSLARYNGTLQSPASMDYFIYTRDTLDWNYDLEENDYLIGGIHFDLFWLATAMTMIERGEMFSVDASQTVLALHQNAQKDMRASGRTMQSFYNRQLTTIAGNRDYLLSNDRVLRMPFFTATRTTMRLDKYVYKLQFFYPQRNVYVLRRDQCFSRYRG